MPSEARASDELRAAALHAAPEQGLICPPSNPVGVATCDKCTKKPVTYIKYSGAHLCAPHFCDFIERRASKELRRQLDLKGGERMAVAVSGGKDSIVALQLVSHILGARKDFEMCAVTVDEGIEHYRPPAIPLVSELCGQLGVEHIVVSFKDLYGITMDEIAGTRRDLSACSYCGVLRRSAMNRAAREWRADFIATGLNLDDTAQSILMNLCRGDVERLARLGPHRNAQPGLVRRIQPLRMIPENETTLYALVRRLRYHDLECPYAPEALRNTYREVLAKLEDRFPGTRHSIIKSYDELVPALEVTCEPAGLATCSCGEPTIGKSCKVCELLDSLRRRESVSPSSPL